MDINVDINLIKAERNKRGWTQSQLADICSLSLRTIQRIEKSGLASHESVQSLAAAFGITVEKLAINEIKSLSTAINNLDKSTWSNKPFYLLGAVGFIVTALMHMLLAILLSSRTGDFNHSIWFFFVCSMGWFFIRWYPTNQRAESSLVEARPKRKKQRGQVLPFATCLKRQKARPDPVTDPVLHRQALNAGRKKSTLEHQITHRPVRLGTAHLIGLSAHVFVFVRH